jgi:hypothetical protein
MPSAPYDRSISTARAGALFASPLQRSDEPSARQVRQAIAAAIGAHGVRGCAARVAQAYGEHPETESERPCRIRAPVSSAEPRRLAGTDRPVLEPNAGVRRTGSEVIAMRIAAYLWVSADSCDRQWD